MQSRARVATFRSKKRTKTKPKNLKKRRKAKQGKRTTEYPIPSSQLAALSPITQETPCLPAGHGHLPGQLPGLPRPPHRQAARLVRAVLAPAQRSASRAAAATAAAAAAAAATYASAAAAAAGTGEAEARGGRGLDGLGRVVADAAVRDRGRAGVGRVPGLRRRVGAAQDPLRGRAAAGQHEGCGAGAGSGSAQWNSVLRDAGRRRRRPEAGRPGCDRPAGAGGRRRRGVRGHVRRREEAAGPRHGIQAVHEGDVRGHRVRPAVHEERRQAACGRPAGARLRRRRRRLRGRRRAGASRGDAGVRRAGGQGVHRAGLRLIGLRT